MELRSKREEYMVENDNSRLKKWSFRCCKSCFWAVDLSGNHNLKSYSHMGTLPPINDDRIPDDRNQ